MFLVATNPLVQTGDASAETESILDVEYDYATHGSQHPDYWAEILQISSDSEEIWISSVLEGYEVTTIRSGAGDACTAVTALVIPATVETIEEGAFVACSELDTVYFIGDRPEYEGAFPDGTEFLHLPDASGWSDGENITVYEEGGVRYAEVEGELAVIGCVASGSVTIADEVDGIPVTSLGPCAFAGIMTSDGSVDSRTDVTEVILGANVETIRERAFYYCEGLVSASLGGVWAIMDEAFRMASSLVAVELPDTLSFIGFEAFRGCSSLTAVVVPDGVMSMGEGTFRLCSSLESAVLGRGLESVPDWMFSHCTSLASVEILGELSFVGGYAFYLCEALVSIGLPSSVLSIGTEAFRDCTSLESVDVGDSLVSLGDGAFNGCKSLIRIDLPATLESVGSRAFAYCTYLEEVRFEGPMPEFGRNVFLGTDVDIAYPPDEAGSWSSYEGDSYAYDDTNVTWLYAVSGLVALVVVIMLVLMWRGRNARWMLSDLCSGQLSTTDRIRPTLDGGFWWMLLPTLTEQASGGAWLSRRTVLSPWLHIAGTAGPLT